MARWFKAKFDGKHVWLRQDGTTRMATPGETDLCEQLERCRERNVRLRALLEDNGVGVPEDAVT